MCIVHFREVDVEDLSKHLQLHGCGLYQSIESHRAIGIYQRYMVPELV